MDAEERFEKIEAGIRDLIVVSRTTLSAVEQLGRTVGEFRETLGEMHETMSEVTERQKRTEELLQALLQAQTETEIKLQRLEDTVDKLTRYRGPNGQSGKPN